MIQQVHDGPLTATARDAWVDATNRRISISPPGWPDGRPAIRAIIAETISVEKDHRRQGHCKRFLDVLLQDGRFELVVVQGVRNPHLAAFLSREGWECPDAVVGDWFKPGAGKKGA